MEILLDTNFLIYIAKYKIASELDKFFPKKLFLPEQVLREIKGIAAKGKGADKESAVIALALINNWKNNKKLFVVQTIVKSADKALLELAITKAANKDIAVATLDKKLIKRLKKAKIGIIGIRQKKYIMLD